MSQRAPSQTFSDCPHLQVNTGKRRQLQSGGNVSIYDGVLPSPDLGPRPPPPAANTTAARAATERVTVSGGHHCSAGCVAGKRGHALSVSKQP